MNFSKKNQNLNYKFNDKRFFLYYSILKKKLSTVSGPMCFGFPKQKIYMPLALFILFLEDSDVQKSQ